MEYFVRSARKLYMTIPPPSPSNHPVKNHTQPFNTYDAHVTHRSLGASDAAACASSVLGAMRRFSFSHIVCDAGTWDNDTWKVWDDTRLKHGVHDARDVSNYGVHGAYSAIHVPSNGDCGARGARDASNHGMQGAYSVPRICFNIIATDVLVETCDSEPE